MLYRFLLENIHTILLILGLFFICLAAFLFNYVAGFLVLGIFLIVLAYFIDKNS